jgi:hypothetical protein
MPINYYGRIPLNVALKVHCLHAVKVLCLQWSFTAQPTKHTKPPQEASSAPSSSHSYAPSSEPSMMPSQQPSSMIDAYDKAISRTLFSAKLPPKQRYIIRPIYDAGWKAILISVFGAVAESQRHCIDCPIHDTISVPIYPTIGKAILSA